MARYALVLFFGLVTIGISGCGSSTQKPPEGATVKGTVNLDGKPMAEGEITFIAPGFPKVLKISNGTYSGEAHVGKNRIEIQCFKVGPPLSTDPKGPPTKVNFLPAKYNGSTTLSADVTSGGANEFKFDVTSQ